MEPAEPSPEARSRGRRRIFWLAGLVAALVVLLGALENFFGALTETGKSVQRLTAWWEQITSCDRFKLAGEVYLLSCDSNDGHTLRAFTNDDGLLAEAFHQCNPEPYWHARFKHAGYAYEIELHSSGELANTITYKCSGDECVTDAWHKLAGLTYFPPSSPCE